MTYGEWVVRYWGKVLTEAAIRELDLIISELIGDDEDE